MTAVLAILALGILFPLFALSMRGWGRAGETECPGEAPGQCGATCGAKGEATDCPLARPGSKRGGR